MNRQKTWNYFRLEDVTRAARNQGIVTWLGSCHVLDWAWCGYYNIPKITAHRSLWSVVSVWERHVVSSRRFRVTRALKCDTCVFPYHNMSVSKCVGLKLNLAKYSCADTWHLDAGWARATRCRGIHIPVRNAAIKISSSTLRLYPTVFTLNGNPSSYSLIYAQIQFDVLQYVHTVKANLAFLLLFIYRTCTCTVTRSCMCSYTFSHFLALFNGFYFFP